MAARDRWEETIRCPGCSAEETVKVSEDDHSWQRDPGFRFDESPQAFTVLETSFYPSQNRLRCSGCEREFRLREK